MTVFNRDLHDAAEPGAYVGLRVIRGCPKCRAPNVLDLANCGECGAAQPAPEPVRLIQGRLTDGTLRWFHLARYALLLARWLNKLADRLEGKDG